MGVTEKTIFEQFSYWQQALDPVELLKSADITVFVGCGTSYNLALSLAAQANASGRPAIAAPGGEWTVRPEFYTPDWKNAHVVVLSRSGETTETVAAAKASRDAGAFVTAITMEAESSIAKTCDRLLHAATHPQEGIVMTTSASLMLLLGLKSIGIEMPSGLPDQARSVLKQFDARHKSAIASRSHFVFLGGGCHYGVALEGALKLMEMSQTFTQAFHPLEYRHGPISLIDPKSAAIILYTQDQKESEAKLAAELQDKGASVIGFGGPGDISFDVPGDSALAGLICLPALQILGERVAQERQLDTMAPRHLTKVVTLK